MNNNIKYLFDSDVLMSSDRIHYRPNFCQAFWDWIEDGHSKKIFYSLDIVKKEIGNTDDSEDTLLNWSKRKSLSSFFLKSEESVSKWTELAKWVGSRQPAYLEAAKKQFLDDKHADAWLISYSMHFGGFCIVTQEVSEPQSKKIVKIPDAANAQGISTISLPKLLNLHAIDNFSLKHPIT